MHLERPGHRVTAAYDAADRAVTTTDAPGSVWTTAYDAAIVPRAGEFARLNFPGTRLTEPHAEESASPAVESRLKF